VRIPAEGRPKLIQKQTEKLYTEIQRGCQVSRERKAALRMLLNAEELQSYLQCAFDHFARTLDDAFDFVQASFFNNPIPLDFGGNILKLAINMMEQKEHTDARSIFDKLSYMVASCIMQDSVRHNIKGMSGADNDETVFMWNRNCRPPFPTISGPPGRCTKELLRPALALRICHPRRSSCPSPGSSQHSPFPSKHARISPPLPMRECPKRTWVERAPAKRREGVRCWGLRL
jgi:hypothetical protein